MASNDVVLGSALRSNLLTLQNTQRSIDSTQLRLATGKRVNSALDNPQQFFTAQALNNRASDLTRLLDGIGQSIKTIEAADKGVTALTKLVEQADSIVSSARDELAASEGEARIVGTTDLRAFTDLTAAPFAAAGIATGDVIRIQTVNDAGTAIAQNITITTGDTAYTLAAKITDAFADNAAGEITARINSSTGGLEISSKGGRTFKIGDTGANTVTLAGYTALGIGRYFEDETRTTNPAAGTLASATIVAGSTVKSISLYEAPGNLADAGDVIANSTYTDANGITAVAAIGVTDTLNFVVNNGAASGAITLAVGTTWQDVVDQINGTAAVNQLIRASFNSDTGSLEITSISDTVENVGVTLTTVGAPAGRSFNLGWGDSRGVLDDLSNTGVALPAGTNETIIAFNKSTQSLDQFSKDFNTVRSQINDLVKDANYRGVNLLQGDNLTTFFNEDNTSSLVTEGATFTSDGLGLVVANFSSSSAIESMSAIVRDALNEVRSFGSSLANNLSIIQTRQSFTQETINTLEAGASELTDADLNEEGAKLLALQTAQQLGVTALSLASQSQQSVLRLF